MDPEQQRQYEEHLARVNEMLGQQSAAMAGLTKAMQDQINALKSEANATNNATNAANANANAQNQNVASTNALTKAQEANIKAEIEYEKAMGNFKASLGSAKNSLVSFSDALLTGEKGFGKYGSAMGQAGEAAWQLGKSFGPLGAVVGGVVKGFTMLGQAVIKQLDDQVKFRESLGQFGGAVGNSVDGLAKLGRDAGYASQDLAKLAKPLQTAGAGLVNLGGNAAQGAKAFMEMANVGSDTRRQFKMMGISQEELTNMQAQYVALQRASGNAISGEIKDKEALKKKSIEYADNLVRLSSLTGKSADDIAAQQQQQQMEFEELMQKRKENAQIARLEATGRKEDADRARDIKAQQETRTKLINDATAKFGAETASKIGRLARTGTYDAQTAGLANMGINAADVKKQVDAANRNTDTEKAGAAIGNKLSDTINKSLDRQATQLGTAMQYGGEELAKQFGGSKELLLATASSGEAARRGKSDAQRDAEVKEAQDKQKQGFVKDASGKWVKDTKAAAAADLQEKEIAARVKVDEKLNEVTNTVINNFDKLEKAAMALAVVFGAMALGKGVMALKDLAGGAGKLLGRGAKAGAEVAEAAAAKPGLLSRATGALGKMVKPLSGVGGRLGGGLMKAAGVGGRVLGKLAAPLAIGMTAYDAYKGWGDAEKNLGIQGRKATTGEKVSSAAGSALSGLTFGLIGADTISKGLYSSSTALAKMTGFGGKTHSGLPHETMHATAAGHPIPPQAAKAMPGTPQSIKALQEEAEAKGKANDATTTLTDSSKLLSDQSDKLKEKIEIQSKTQDEALLTFKGKLDAASTSLKAFKDALDTLATQMGSMGGAPGGAPSAGAPGGAGPSGPMPPVKQDAAKNLGMVADALQKKGLGDPAYIKAVLGNVMKESGGRIQNENLNYAGTSNDRIRSIFGERAKSKSDAELNEIKKDPTKMAEMMYGADTKVGRGMGNTKPGDGWKYRGRGYIQLTGKSNYAAASKAIFGDDRLVENPDLVNEPTTAAEVVAWYMDRGKSSMARKMGINTSGPMSQDQANLLATSQIAGGDVRKMGGYVGGELLGKVAQYAQGMPTSSAGATQMAQAPDKKMKAASGLIADGPDTGYPVEHHGLEITAPLDMDSILMKLAKTPAPTTDNVAKADSKMDSSSGDIGPVIEMLSDKLDAVIEALENGNETSSKLLKRTSV